MTAILLISSMFTGCAGIETADGKKTQKQGAVGGAAIGALAGGLIGGDWQGALIGAAIGGAAGLAYGTHVAGKKADYANTENYLDAVIAEASRVNTEAYAYNNKLKGQVSAHKKAVAALGDADKKTRTAKRKEIERDLATARKQQKTVNREISIQQRVYEENKDAPDASNSPQSMASSISKLEKTESALSDNIDQLAALSNQLRG